VSVRKHADGRRSVDLEFELPGTPEQVWEALATGPGIATWFVPADIEPREGGAVTFHLAPDPAASFCVRRTRLDGRRTRAGD
jgi:uncharacterized protein YndB with AHSA1/START domain